MATQNKNTVYLTAAEVAELRGKSGLLDVLFEELDPQGGITLTQELLGSIPLRSVRNFLVRTKNPKKAISIGENRPYAGLIVEPKERLKNHNESKFGFTQENANRLAGISDYFATQPRNPNQSLTLTLANQLRGENNTGPFNIPRTNVRKFLKTIRNNLRGGPKREALSAAFGKYNLNETTNRRLRTVYRLPNRLTREAARNRLAAIKRNEPRFRGNKRSERKNKTSKLVRAAATPSNPFPRFGLKLKQNRKTRRSTRRNRK